MLSNPWLSSSAGSRSRDVDLRDRADRERRCRTRCGSADGPACKPGSGCVRACAIERRFERGGEARSSVGVVRPRHALRRHHAAAQLRPALSPRSRRAWPASAGSRPCERQAAGLGAIVVAGRAVLLTSARSGAAEVARCGRGVGGRRASGAARRRAAAGSSTGRGCRDRRRGRIDAVSTSAQRRSHERPRARHGDQERARQHLPSAATGHSSRPKGVKYNIAIRPGGRRCPGQTYYDVANGCGR